MFGHSGGSPPNPKLLLMEDFPRSPVEVGSDYPITYKVLAPFQVVIAGFLNHQQYHCFEGQRGLRPLGRLIYSLSPDKNFGGMDTQT